MRLITFFAFVCCLVMSACEQTSNEEFEHTNELINESSPYLLQHAHNPVDWYPWGEAALEKARKEDKLLIVSIGYAACHWCHVMEHESFEDSTVAALMNEHFVSIKVDREERPDIDDVYMTACQMASGRGCGWPLNAFALPNGQPVWAGTYFPKAEWMRILDQFVNLKKDEPEKLKEYAQQLTDGIQRNEMIPIETGEREFTRESIDTLAERFMNNVDGMAGGRVGAPKFPMPNNWQFLLRYGVLAGNELAQRAATNTLDNMADGGIYDQIGGGFSRYSVDAKWHVPHFEKMLYDNGQLVSLYSQAYQLTGNPTYERIVRETLTFIERELSDVNGGFYSSLDADSEGEEGKFYVWTKDEIDLALNDELLSAIAVDYYDVQPGGNWEEDKNILQITKTEQAIARKYELTEQRLQFSIGEIKRLLLEKRAERVRPGLDDKILTSWNALMMKGYVDAYRAFGDEAYLERALKNADFIETNMVHDEGRLNRNFKDGKSVINAFLDDYATLIEAYLSLYQVTFDEAWLEKGKSLADHSLKHFFDDTTGLFFYTSDLDPPLIARKKELGDNVIPASNSIMAKNLHRLGLLLYNQDYLEVSRIMLGRMAATLESTQDPSFYSNWCDVYSDYVWPLYEVAIVGDASLEKSHEMMKAFVPQALFLGGINEGSLELLKDKLQEGRTLIYVCQNKVCKFPVDDPAQALTLMD